MTLAGIALIGAVDSVTGFELGFFVFYFLPVIASASRLGHEGAVGAALLSATVWAVADYLSGHTYSTQFFAVWNTLVRLIAFLVVGFAFARIRQMLTTERETNEAIRRAQSEIKVLEGLLPICSDCKKIRDDEGRWTRMESYISERSRAEFSHGLCPDCLRRAMKAAGLDDASSEG